ncbi:GntR family transcriptional regulator [Streptomyces sp. NPDC005840]|uniref:GntR family transcriptional regulator n=1 Tax=Streptomyces doudnae TaxID=3075536 RepID=A0ABD5ENV3_9ACTN|nr:MULTISPECIES: GntR family transcriptional regulator [unclassified Streptomyces]MDT0435719.1 GntR family transcriptional regulator [Streptomyces sp. DSM 41981]MYQ66801.1 FCD domain-containing protein [Streptomyces sp. SID4950]SCE25521.1 transcriptional regulator, GntR family [Streptomyces sp. SolWspMP-5a-2]
MSQTHPTAPVASQRIAELIRDRILSGQLPPGTRIVQDELAEELDSSRLPVREALRILQSTGLVTLRANHGAWVSSMTLRDCTLSYQMRERLEPLLLAESMPLLTADHFDRLRALQAEIEATDDVEEFLVLDRRLHWLTYQAQDTGQLTHTVARLWDTTQHYRRAFTHLTARERKWITNAEHHLLIQALEDTDSASAQNVLTTHIRRTRLELTHHPAVFA